MGKAIYTMTLDLNTTFSQSTVYAKQGDTDRQLIITLRSEGKAFSVDGALVVLSATTPSGKTIEESTDIIDNKIIYDFSKELTATVGNMDVELRIYKDGTVISPTFTLVVEERNNSTPVVESDSFKALDDLYVSTNEATIRANDAAHFASSVALELEEARDNGEFKGEKGDKGDKGDKGEKGDRGEPGNSESPDYMIVAPAIPNETSGTAIAITDISPLEHILGVKATSDTVDVSTAKVQRYGKNLFNIDKVVDEKHSGAYIEVNGNDIIFTYGTGETNHFVFSCEVEVTPNTDYVISIGKTTSVNTYYVYADRLFGTSIKANVAINTGSFNSGNNNKLVIGFWSTYPQRVGTSEVISEIMLIRKDTQAISPEYEPYTEPTTYDINADGTVEGVTSLYPTTTLISDTEGIVLDVEYNADTKKYIDNKIAEVVALALEV